MGTNIHRLIAVILGILISIPLPIAVQPALSESPLSPPTGETAATPVEHLPAVQSPEIEPEIKQLIASSPSAETLPNDAIIILLKDQHHFVNADGTATIHSHELVKILREAGKAMSQVTLPYNKSKEELKVEIVRTIKSNGKIVNGDTELIQDTAVLRDVPLFSDMRIRQLVFPDVSAGDYLELKYTIRIKEPIIRGVYNTYFTYPLGLLTKTSRLSINLPQSMKPHYAVTLPGKTAPEILEKGKRIIYRWAPEPIALSRGHEPAIPPSFDVDPYVFFSTMESWKVLTEWYVPLFENTLKDISDQIQTKVDQIKLAAENNREKTISMLYEFVSQQVDYIGITLGDSAWKPYPPSYVMANRYGDCKGKAGLLIAMLRMAGIDAYGVLIKPSDQGRMLMEIPALNFTHMIVAVKENNLYRFMDPTIPMAPYDFLMPFELNRDVIILDRTEPHLAKTPHQAVEQNNYSACTEDSIMLENGHINSKAVMEFHGLAAIDHRMMIRKTNPAILRDIFEKNIRQHYPQSQLKDYSYLNYEDVNKPFIIKMEGTIVGATQTAGNLLLLEQPSSVLNPSLTSLVTFDQRYYPIFLGIGEMQTWKGTITPPKNYRLKSLPKNITMKRPFGMYKRHFRFKDGKITGASKIVLDQPVIPVTTYRQFKKFVEKISQYEKEKIVFEAVGAQAPPKPKSANPSPESSTSKVSKAD